MSSSNGMRRRCTAALLGLALTGLGPVGLAEAAGNGVITVTAVENGDTSAAPRSGVVFTLGRVDGVDPATPAGQQQFTQLQANLADGSPAVVDVVTLGATDGQGSVSLSGLSDGVYVLHEVGVSHDGSVDHDPNQYGDILIPIPLMDPEGNPVESIDVMPKREPSVPDLPLHPTTPSPTPVPSASPSPVGTPVPTPAPTSGRVTNPPAAPERPAGTAPQTTGTQTTGTQTTRINSGGGSDFDAAAQWATIAAGTALVWAAFLGTRRRKDEE